MYREYRRPRVQPTVRLGSSEPAIPGRHLKPVFSQPFHLIGKPIEVTPCSSGRDSGASGLNDGYGRPLRDDVAVDFIKRGVYSSRKLQEPGRPHDRPVMWLVKGYIVLWNCVKE